MNNDTITPLPPTGQPSPHTARRSMMNRGRRRYFTSKECAQAQDHEKRRTGRIYNGMTGIGLGNLFECDVFHKAGVGFYWYPDCPTAAFVTHLRGTRSSEPVCQAEDGEVETDINLVTCRKCQKMHDQWTKGTV